MKLKFLNENIIRRLKSSGGESITEVLVASLVIAFGSILLATMVTASTKIIQKAMIAYQSYMDVHNGMEMVNVGGLPADLTMMTSDGTEVPLTETEEIMEAVISDGSLYGNKLNLTGVDGNNTYSQSGPFEVSEKESVKVFTVPAIKTDGSTGKYSFSKYFATEITS